MHYNCLIIDDEKLLADNTCEYFNMFEVPTKAVYSKAEALEFLEANSASLILLDINLGDGSGFELCKHIRETSTAPILFISARNTDDDKILALNIGGDDYIEKPYSLGVLLAKVRVMLKRLTPVEGANSGSSNPGAGAFGAGAGYASAGQPAGTVRADKDTAGAVLDDFASEYGTHVISTMNFYEILEGSMTTFKDISTMMLAVICAVSAAIIMLVLYLLIKALVYNKRRDYGIYKALGYTSTSLRFQTAVSFMPSIILSVIVFSIVSYYLANPYMSNILRVFGLMKSTFVIPIPGVVIIGIFMVVLAFLFALINTKKIKDIEPINLLTAE